MLFVWYRCLHCGIGFVTLPKFSAKCPKCRFKPVLWLENMYDTKYRIRCLACDKYVTLFGISATDIANRAVKQGFIRVDKDNGKIHWYCSKKCAPKTPLSKPSINGIPLYTFPETPGTNNANETR